jgi:hypothetical protein
VNGLRVRAASAAYYSALASYWRRLRATPATSPLEDGVHHTPLRAVACFYALLGLSTLACAMVTIGLRRHFPNTIAYVWPLAISVALTILFWVLAWLSLRYLVLRRLGLIGLWQTTTVTASLFAFLRLNWLFNALTVAALVVPFFAYVAAFYGGSFLAKWRALRVLVLALASLVLTVAGYLLIYRAGALLTGRGYWYDCVGDNYPCTKGQSWSGP